MKGEAAVGDIQNEAAVFRAHADIGDLHEFRSRSLTAVRRRYSKIRAFAQTTLFPAGVWIVLLF